MKKVLLQPCKYSDRAENFNIYQTWKRIKPNIVLFCWTLGQVSLR